jgi:hypothetical protein
LVLRFVVAKFNAWAFFFGRNALIRNLNHVYTRTWLKAGIQPLDEIFSCSMLSIFGHPDVKHRRSANISNLVKTSCALWALVIGTHDMLVWLLLGYVHASLKH